MARIPEAEIERLKNDISVERLVESSGITLKKAGKDLLGPCPFHEDSTPSLVITPAKNLWHCFGCGIGGGPIDWVMKKNGVSFRHAVELLREGISSLAAGVIKQSTVRALPPPIDLEADDQVLLNQVTGYYHETLKSSQEGLDYLRRRGLNHPELIDRFKLGYANRTLGLRLPLSNRVAGAMLRSRLQRLGILRESGHEHLHGSLVVPIFDETGNVKQLYGRKIGKVKEGTPHHLYLPGPHCAVWHIEALQASKEVILCESLIDALSFWCAGYRNVTTSYGIEGLTEAHLTAFKQYKTQRVLIAYDRDEAGERGAAKVAEKLLSEGIECWRIEFPKGMDANDYALKVQPADKSLGLLIRKAIWLGSGAAPKNKPTALPVEILLSTIESHQNMPASVATTNEPPAEIKTAIESSPVIPVALEKMAEPLLETSVKPSAPEPEAPIDVKENEVSITFGDRRYRIRGLQKNHSLESLKINLLISHQEAFYVDMLDLYSAKARAGYVTQAAIELRINEAILKADLGRLLLKCEGLQDERLQALQQPAQNKKIDMADTEREAALALLKSPDLLERILTDFETCGVVGERINKLVGYLAAVSRKLDKPLAVVIQSSSAAGKSSLMDAVLAFLPEEERIKYSAMTGQSLFYMGKTNLKHKVLAICEEEGAQRATYALKVLQSDGELTIASTGKDPTTGNLVTQEYRVEGPVMLFLTTTTADLDEELQNRFLVLSVDEGREQTEAIHRLQRSRRTLAGLIAKNEREHIQTLHQNAQRLLRSLAVMNPYADQLTFLATKTRMRRDHEKYLTLIDTIALLHQHQRDVKSISYQNKTLEYIEATLEDIAQANALAHEILGRSLDELPPQTRRLLDLITNYVAERAHVQAIPKADVRFSRRELREATSIGDTQLRLHLERLIELEYVIAHREGVGGKYVYSLLYDGEGQDGQPFVPGLLDIKALQDNSRIQKSRGLDSEVAGALRGGFGPVAGGLRVMNSSENPHEERRSELTKEKHQKMHSTGNHNKTASYIYSPFNPVMN